MKTNQEIIDFIKNNQEDKISEYYNLLYLKLTDLHKRMNRTSLFFILIAGIYFFSSKASFESIQLGPVVISDFSMIFKLTPLLFAYFILEYSILNYNSSQTIKMIKWIALVRYNQKLTKTEFSKNFFVNIILPYSFWMTVESIYDFRKPKLYEILIILPAITLAFFPFLFEYISLKKVIIFYWDDLFAKFSVITSIWIVIYVCIYYVRMLSNIFHIQKLEKIPLQK